MYPEYDQNFICHHGIKGQRWGERRFQNEDGTLTPAGKKRYAKQLYSVMKSNNSKNMNITEYEDSVKNVLKSDKRVQDYISKHKEEMKKMSDDWGDAYDKKKQYVDEHLASFYKKSKKNAEKDGIDLDSNTKYLDYYVQDVIENDPKVRELEKNEKKYYNRMANFSKNTKPLVDDIMQEYGKMPTKTWNHYNPAAEVWVSNAIDSLLLRSL